jgi:thiosulfate dehydrogenase [quinone] large subunit
MKKETILAVLRITMGFIFFWAGIDKVFGLGFATASDQSWLNGVSPTAGFLTFGTGGVFSSVFQSLAGSAVIDYLFMLGLFSVGLALLLGIGVKIAGYAGSLLMLLIYLSLFPPENNPFVDEHIVYIVVLLLCTTTPVGETFGFGGWWTKTKLVKRLPFLA